MATAKTKRISINDQIVTITQQSTKPRKSLDEKRSPETLEGLKNLEDSLPRVSEVLIPFEQQFSHLQALAGIGQVVNSTLEVTKCYRS